MSTTSTTISFILFLFITGSISCQEKKASEPTPQAGSAAAVDAPSATNSQDVMKKRVAAIETELAARKDSDFELQIGIGSLIRNGDTTDYSDNANTLAASNLGSATPQYLLGVGLRTPIPNFHTNNSIKAGCYAYRTSTTGAKKAVPKQPENVTGTLVLSQYTGDQKAEFCPYWQIHPWSGFISLKFAPSSSDSIVGYVLGGSYSAGHYLNVLIGFGLTPVNEPSYGLRATASQYVAAQQKLGLLTNFDPNAMLNDYKNAFDGFSLLDATGKLIYQGTPLETHYRGSFVVGIAVPVNFSDFLKGK